MTNNGSQWSSRTWAGAKDIVEMPWLETEYRIDESDWIVLSDDGWRAVADSDPTIWGAVERKLLVGFYVSMPQPTLQCANLAEDLS